MPTKNKKPPRKRPSRSRARSATPSRLTRAQYEKYAAGALNELRTRAPYFVSFRCEPWFAAEGQSKPIQVVAEFRPPRGKVLKIAELAPIARWLRQEVALKR